ncbi:protein O-mannosyl-transferase family [Sinomicrobium sp. M5D2P17]
MITTVFNRWNTLLGWVVFLIALTTYGLTVEPTVSFWDCGEYIATSSGLEVGHPPGAPLFQMLGAVFSIFATGPGDIALAVNCISVLSSAFTILFMFWVITNLVKKIAIRNGEMSAETAIAILGSGVVGSLAFTFSDSFWFSAVEAEVYAMASLLMSLLLWLGLKWTDNLHSPRGNRWLLLIALITGMAFGLHFMGFLAIPSVVLLYYFKKYRSTTVKNFIAAHFLAIVILILVYQFSLTYILKLFAWGELFIVNHTGLPFHSGSIITALAIITLFGFALRYTRRRKLYQANTLVLCLLLMYIGFSSWLMLPIRANAHTPINENDPSDARLLLSYYNREQYGDANSPLYGTMYSDMFAEKDADQPFKDDKPKYEQDEKTGNYVVVNKYKNVLQAPNSRHVGILPRMWSREHAANYMKLSRPLQFSIKSEYISNKELKDTINRFKADYTSGKINEEGYVDFLQQLAPYINVAPPALWDNLKFMFQYQFGYMYWRYFMWNFAGRQNDIQGQMDNNGNWISGVKAVDEKFIGSQDNLPSDVLNNKARNTYFFLPLLLGLVGLLFQVRKDPKRFWVLFVFFIFTGIAIQFYTNVRPFEPRERDYSLVGSFYIFAIWIGMGVFALYNGLRKLLSPKILAPAVKIICLLAVPVIMAYQNWDDHDRSDRYIARAMARNTLDSIQKDADAIVFTLGENDIFGMWYAQEVEKHRTDVRVVYPGYLATDWYIDQMKQKAHKSNPVPSQLIHKQYVYGTRDILYHQPLTEERWDIKRFMNWIANDENTVENLIRRQGGSPEQYPEAFRNTVFYPTNKIRVPVNKENVLRSGLVKNKDEHLITDYIDIDLPQGGMTKSQMMLLDILANNDWKRPIYFTGGSFDPADYLWLREYMQLDGLVYKLVPIKTPVSKENPYEMGRIDSDLMYDKVMKWDWGNSDKEGVYHDSIIRRRSISYRINMARLAETLLRENKKDRAIKVMDLAIQKMPPDHYGYYTFLEPFIEGYYQAGDTGKARDLFRKTSKKYQENLDYYLTSCNHPFITAEDIVFDIQRYRSLVDIVVKNDEEAFGKEETTRFNRYLDRMENDYLSRQSAKL